MNADLCYFAVLNDGVTTVHGFASTVTKETFFAEVAKTIAFGDCTDDQVVQIVWQGKEVKYDGWRRGMYFGFSDCDTGKCVYGASFPEYDH